METHTLNEEPRDFPAQHDCRHFGGWVFHDDQVEVWLDVEEYFPHDYNSNRVPESIELTTKMNRP